MATARALDAFGRRDEAMVAYSTVAGSDGSAAAGRLALALATAAATDVAHGLSALDAAIGDARAPAEAAYRRAEALEEMGLLGEAAEAYAAYGAAVPAMRDVAAMARGLALFTAGDYRGAAAAFAEALDTASGAKARFLATLRLGNAQLRFRPEAALDTYRSAFEAATADGERAQALDGQIAALAYMGRATEADEVRRRLVASLPETELAPAALMRLDESGAGVDAGDAAAVLVADGRATEALQRLDAAIASQGERDEWRLERARALLEIGEPAAALDALESVERAGLTEEKALAADLLRVRALDDLGRGDEWAEAVLNTAQSWPRAEPAAVGLRAWAARVTETDGWLAGAEAWTRVAEILPRERQDGTEAFRGAFLALMAGDDDRAARRLDTLTRDEDESASARASYWLGRIAAAKGDASEARELWASAAERDPDGLYGILSLERLGGAPSRYESASADRPAVDAVGGWLASWVPGADAAQLAVEREAARESREIQRAHAWLALGDRRAASADLAAARSAAWDDPVGLAALAMAADEMGMTAAAAASAERLLALAPDARRQGAPIEIARLAYPTDHAATVRERAAAEGVDPLLVFAVIRQESRFEPTARSSAGATGLMQIMPDTGSHVARMVGDDAFEVRDLNDPDTSIRYGVWYLARMLERYDGRERVALAAYNAGAGNADRWLLASGGDEDAFLELVDFSETRSYLRRVVEARSQYERMAADGLDTPAGG